MPSSIYIGDQSNYRTDVNNRWFDTRIIVNSYLQQSLASISQACANDYNKIIKEVHNTY